MNIQTLDRVFRTDTLNNKALVSNFILASRAIRAGNQSRIAACAFSSNTPKAFFAAFAADQNCVVPCNATFGEGIVSYAF
jgi:hypothetical protein